MFRFVGFIAIMFIFVVGFTSIKKWYEGELNPNQAISEIRQSISNVISSDTSDLSRKQLIENAEPDDIPNSSASDKDINANNSKENQEEYSTDQIASELQKKAIN